MVQPVEVNIQSNYREIHDTFSADMKAITSLAEKWHLISQIYHSQGEFEAYLSIIRNLGSQRILDCACGTGFPSIELARRGFNIVGSDIDLDNLELLRTLQGRASCDFPLFNCSWFNLDKEAFGEQFDLTLCLGSSITYFESWNEGVAELSMNFSDMRKCLECFRTITKPGGFVLIGICKHYTKTKRTTSITFKPRHIGGETYHMTWALEYFWDKRLKTWQCDVSNIEEESFSIRLISYLFDKDELKDFCLSTFRNVKEIDVCPEPYHDILLLCEV